MMYKLYESYGTLERGNRPVYSDNIPATEHYNVVTVELPFELAENKDGETLIDLDGKTYLLHEVLTCWGDKPCLAWYDHGGYHRVMLNVLALNMDT